MLLVFIFMDNILEDIGQDKYNVKKEYKLVYTIHHYINLWY